MLLTVQALLLSSCNLGIQPYGEEKYYQSTGDEIVTNLDFLSIGRLTVESPNQLSPASSDIIVMEISIPSENIDKPISQFDRVFIDPNNFGRMPRDFQTYVLVTQKMRAELQSPSFDVQAMNPEQQALFVVPTTSALSDTTIERALQTETATSNIANQSKRWVWTIKAPTELGLQVLILKLFLDDNPDPTWLGALYLDVSVPATATLTPEPTETLIPIPTTTLTLTPVPLVVEFGKGIVSNPVGFLSVIVTLILGVLGFLTVRKNSNANKKNSSKRNNRKNRKV